MTATFDEAERLFRAGQQIDAARVCVEMLQSDSRHFNALHLLGVICTNQGFRADAVNYMTRAVAERPGERLSRFNLGNALGAVQRFDEALAVYRTVEAEIAPNLNLWNSMGLVLRGLERTDEAMAYFRAALARDPAFHPARFNLARALRDTGRPLEARAEFQWLRDHLPPDTPADKRSDTVGELILTYMDEEQPELAVTILRESVASGEAAESLLWNQCYSLLVMGRFAEGWRAYEDRWKAMKLTPGEDSTILDPDQIAGKRVLVREEQGRGDNIQFMRYARLLAARGARVFLRTYPDLVCLAQEMPEVEGVLSWRNPDCDYDLATSVMSLPLAFGTELATIPGDVPYLRPPASRVARIRHRLGPRRGLRVGVVWSGSAFSRARAGMSAHRLEPVLRRPGIEFHCLQKDIAAADRAWIEETGQVALHDTAIGDFGDTAALIDEMDLVISIDTAVAHLAGAMAKPVWIMLARNPDWRWLLNRTDSPWYPTARLFRQTNLGDWDGVVRAVAAALPFAG